MKTGDFVYYTGDKITTLKDKIAVVMALCPKRGLKVKFLEGVPNFYNQLWFQPSNLCSRRDHKIK